MATKTINVDELIHEDRVRGAIYSDPDIFAMEMDKIFMRNWVFICHDSQVEQPGDYFTTWLGKAPIIVSRGADDGQVHIFYNRCMHRGNIVCQYESGNANYFRCAYHGWTFTNQGKVAGVPYKEAYGDRLNWNEMGLMPVKVGVYNGCVFASGSENVAPIEEWVGNAGYYLDLFVNQGPAGIRVKAGSQKALYRGNWKFQNENDADNYHTDFTHAIGAVLRSLRARKAGEAIGRLGQPPEAIVRYLGNGHSANHRTGVTDNRDMYAQAKGNSLTKGYVETLETKYGVEGAREWLRNAGAPGNTFRMWPNLVVIGTQFRITRPVSVGVAENYYYPSLLKDVPDEVNAIRLRFHEQGFGPAGFTSPDDVEVFARNQIGLQANTAWDWQVMARGFHREQTADDGTLFSEVKDETGMRHIYTDEWRREMSAVD